MRERNFSFRFIYFQYIHVFKNHLEVLLLFTDVQKSPYLHVCVPYEPELMGWGGGRQKMSFVRQVTCGNASPVYNAT